MSIWKPNQEKPTLLHELLQVQNRLLKEISDTHTELLKEISSKLDKDAITVEEQQEEEKPEIIYDTIVVPARPDGFDETFIGEDRWHAIKLGEHRIEHLKYIAAYQVLPIGAITHVAKIKRIQPWYLDSDRYEVIFDGKAEEIEHIPWPKGVKGAMRSPWFTEKINLNNSNGNMKIIFPWLK